MSSFRASVISESSIRAISLSDSLLLSASSLWDVTDISSLPRRSAEYKITTLESLILVQISSATSVRDTLETSIVKIEISETTSFSLSATSSVFIPESTRSPSATPQLSSSKRNIFSIVTSATRDVSSSITESPLSDKFKVQVTLLVPVYVQLDEEFEKKLAKNLENLYDLGVKKSSALRKRRAAEKIGLQISEYFAGNSRLGFPRNVPRVQRATAGDQTKVEVLYFQQIFCQSCFPF